MSRGILIAIVGGIIAAAIAASVVAIMGDDLSSSFLEGENITDGRQLALNLNENLALQENT